LNIQSPELLGYDVMKRCVRIPTFLRAMQPATSGWRLRKQVSQNISTLCQNSGYDFNQETLFVVRTACGMFHSSFWGYHPWWDAPR